MEGVLRVTENHDWVFISLLSVVCVFIFKRYFFHKYYSNLNSLYEFTQIKEGFSGFYLINQVALVFLISLIVYPAFLRNINTEYNYYYPLFITLLGVLMLWSFFKIFINFILFVVSDKVEEISDFFHQKLFYTMISLGLYFVISVLTYYSSVPYRFVLYLFLGVFILQILIELFSIVNQMYKKLNIPIYYLFLYLCTLEILPLVYLLKYYW